MFGCDDEHVKKGGEKPSDPDELLDYWRKQVFGFSESDDQPSEEDERLAYYQSLDIEGLLANYESFNRVKDLTAGDLESDYESRQANPNQQWLDIADLPTAVGKTLRIGGVANQTEDVPRPPRLARQRCLACRSTVVCYMGDVTHCHKCGRQSRSGTLLSRIPTVEMAREPAVFGTHEQPLLAITNASSGNHDVQLGTHAIKEREVTRINEQMGVLKPLPEMENEGMFACLDGPDDLDECDDVTVDSIAGPSKQHPRDAYGLLIARLGSNARGLDVSVKRDRALWVYTMSYGGARTRHASTSKKVARCGAAGMLLRELDRRNKPGSRIVGGTKMISNKVKNAGANRGKDKARRDPQPPLRPRLLPERQPYDFYRPALAGPAGPPAAPAEDVRRKKIRSNYVCGSKPMYRCLHLNDAYAHHRTYDQGASPFCGLAAIDVAVNGTTNVNTYLDMLSDDQLDDPWDVVGTVEFLGTWAKARGVNLIITVRIPDEGINVLNRFDGGFYHTVHLRYIPHADDLVGVGHFVLMVDTVSADNGMPMHALEIGHEVDEDHLQPVRSICFRAIGAVAVLVAAHPVIPIVLLPAVVRTAVFFALTPLLECLARIGTEPVIELLGERVYEIDNRDRRTIANRRDTIIHQDSYRRVAVTWKCYHPYYPGRLDCGPIEQLINKYHNRVNREYVVSEPLFLAAYAQMQTLAASGRNPSLALADLGRYRELNTDAGRGTMSSTASFLVFMANQMTITGVKPNLVGLVACAVPGATTNFPNINVIEGNQVGGVNNVRKYKLEAGKADRRVAVSPLGPMLSREGVIGAGLFSITDSPTTLAAFVGRAMTKDLGTRDQRVLDQFIKDSKAFLDSFIDKVVIMEEPEESVFVMFRKAYTGKRSERWIDNKLAMYAKYHMGLMSRKEEARFNQNGFFVKFESNIKDGQPRPRGIMTMSDAMLLECCGALTAIGFWNHSDFSQFQVKSMTPIEVMERLMFHTDGAHAVTDYSAYESSIDSQLRSIEMYVLDRLLARMGWSRTRRALRRYARGERKLVTRWGTFEIDTRCSGDFWTSFGNGVLSVCIMRACWLKNGIPRPFRMLAEGDDGVVDADVPNDELISQIGIGYSSAFRGTQPGDCDFLSRRVVDGKCYLSVGKVLNSLSWVKKGHLLKRSKQLAVLRCMAHSVHHMSPGHPILAEMCNRIWEKTRGVSTFKGMMAYLDNYHAMNYTPPVLGPSKRVEVDESMRAEVASGAMGFMPISISDQLEIESRIRMDEMYVGATFDEDPNLGPIIRSTNGSIDLKLSVESFLAMADVVGAIMPENYDRLAEKEKREFCELSYQGQLLERSFVSH
jgi:hypothetical protein